MSRIVRAAGNRAIHLPTGVYPARRARGVVEFIDFDGANILHHASRELSQTIDATRYAAPPIVGRMVGQGH